MIRKYYDAWTIGDEGGGFIPVSWIDVELDFTGKDWFTVEDIDCEIISSILQENTKTNKEDVL